jgi:glycosyltransferase involved in cell wall biosynthesis
MINPCPWKGSSILVNLARRRPDLAFATVPTWGATPDLIKQLEDIPNMTLLEETPRIDEIFAQTRVLLAPSMCQEAFGLVSPEALLRGIPVIASDIAGLRESTLGVAPLIPVEPLPFDGPKEGTDHTKFVWREPDNPVEPWSRTLDAILESEDSYARASRRSRAAAVAFVQDLSHRSVLSLFN